MRKLVLFAVSCAALAVGLGCKSATKDKEFFVANLEGANEVPARATGANGTASFVIDGRTVFFTIEVRGTTTAPITAAHIHSGAAGVNGPVRVGFFPPAGSPAGTTMTTNGNTILVTGSWTDSDVTGISPDQLLAEMRAGTAYANVHTTTNPGGEIRGQLQKLTVD
jgi:hypothetical protein